MGQWGYFSYIEIGAWLAGGDAPKGSAERFTTDRTIKVLLLAQEEARRLSYNFVGTEQVLLGLIGIGSGIAAKALKSVGVNLKDARVEVEKVIHPSSCVSIEVPFAPETKKILLYSVEEADRLGQKNIGTGHLLLGIIREANESSADKKLEGAGRVLNSLGVDLAALKTKLVEYIEREPESDGPLPSFREMVERLRTPGETVDQTIRRISPGITETVLQLLLDRLNETGQNDP